MNQRRPPNGRKSHVPSGSAKRYTTRSEEGDSSTRLESVESVTTQMSPRPASIPTAPTRGIERTASVVRSTRTMSVSSY